MEFCHLEREGCPGNWGLTNYGMVINHLRNEMILQVPASNKNFQRGSLLVDLNSMQGILDMEDR